MTDAYRRNLDRSIAEDLQYHDDIMLEEQARAEAEEEAALAAAGPVDVPGADQLALEALEAAGPPQPAREPFREFTGEKYEEREDGGTRQTDDYNKYLQAEANVRAFDENPVVQTLQGASDVAMDITQGLGDTAVGVTKLLDPYDALGTSAIRDFWHKHNPQSDNGAHHAIRQISGVVLPSLIIPGAVTSKVATLPWAQALPGAIKTTGAISARLGLDTAIVAASTSDTDENAAKALNDMFGWNLPWATREGAGPDERRKYQLYENLGFAAGAELMQGAFALRTYLKTRPKKNMFEASWVHKYDIERWKITTQGAAPGTQIEWDPGIVVQPKTQEAAEQLIRNADNIAQQTRSAAIKEVDDQIDQLGLLDELGEAEELRLAELIEQRKRIEVDEMAFDPLTRNIDEAVKTRANSLVDEAAERVQTNQGDYDPIIHDPAEAQARAVTTNGPADPFGAALDHVRILNDLNTVKGRARAVLPTKGMRALYNAAEGTERGAILDEITAALTPGQDMEAMIEGTWKVVPEEFQSAVDMIAENIHNLDPKTFASTVNNLKRKALKGAELLPTEDFLVYEAAARKVLNALDPDQLRASALVVRQAADTVQSAASAANILEGVVDTSRQQMNMWENMALVAKETRGVRYLWGYTGGLLDMAKGKRFNTKELVDLVSGFEQKLADEQASATKFINELQQVTEEYPEYLKPFIKAYDISDGNVDEMFKLHRWAEENVSISKLIWDNNPKNQSLLVQGIHGVRYNSMLNGLAPLRAFVGNTTLTIGKPISVLAGSAFQGVTGNPGQLAVMKRGLYTYGGFVENFQRALKHMHKEWSFAVANPEEAMLRGRADVKFAPSDKFEAMESMAEGWRANKQYGKLFLLNMARVTSWYNNLSVNRWGINALHAIDGFTNSMMASGMARASAYDELLDSTKGVINQADFDTLQKKLYTDSFDETGLLTNKAAKHASQEVALNLNSKTVKDFEALIARVPALKPLFMFPRTGINGLKMAWSYNPLSALPEAIGKGNKVFSAKSQGEVLEVLRAHGITDLSDPLTALDTLKAEYRGRQVMGSAVVMGAGLMAVNGDLTGNGPYQAAEKKDMLRLGWRPTSIRLDGRWYSYQGLEPYQQVLSLVADAVYTADRVDSAWTEDIFQKIGYAISMNVTNQTFLSGMSPLVGLISRDETAVKRFIAGWTDPLVPFAWSGSRSILNKAISPQLKDVENEILGFHMNYSKFLFNNNELLKDQLDIYTGKPINYTEPFTAAFNSILPFFKSNGGHEPWRQWLLDSGWNNLNTLRQNKLTGQPLTAEERFFINNWVAKHTGLRTQIERLMVADHKGKYTKRYVNERGQQKQKDFPIDKSYIHSELNRIHDSAFKAAWNALQQENQSYRSLEFLEKQKKGLLKSGRAEAANKTQTQINDLLKLN